MAFFLNKIKKISAKTKEFFLISKWNALLIITLIVLNILFLVFTTIFHTIYEETDGFTYFLYFKDIKEAEFPPAGSSFWPPGLPFGIGLLSILLKDFFMAGKIIMVEFAILFLLSLYLLISSIFNEKVAYLTILILATNHYIILYFIMVINTDIPFSAMINFSLYFLFREQNNTKNIIYSSFFLSLATYIRWSGLLFIPIILVLFIYNFLKNRNSISKFKNNLKYLFCYFITFLIFLCPLFITNLIWFNSPIYNNNVINLYQAIKYYDKSFVIPSNKSWEDLFFGKNSYIFYQQWFYSIFIEVPRSFLEFLFLYDVQILWIFFRQKIVIIISYILFFFIFSSYFLNLKYFKKFKNQNGKLNIKKLNTIIVPFLLVIYIMIISMGFIQYRFLYPFIGLLIAPLVFLLEYFLVIFTSLIKNFVRKNSFRNLRIRNIGHKKVSLILVLIVIPLILFQFLVSLNTLSWQHQNERIEFKIAGDFLNGKVNENDVIALRKQNYLYYIGDCRYKSYPKTGNLSQFFLKLRSYNFLIISERVEVQYRPDLRFLLNSSNFLIPDYIQPIFHYDETNRRIIIYKVLNHI